MTKSLGRDIEDLDINGKYVVDTIIEDIPDEHTKNFNLTLPYFTTFTVPEKIKAPYVHSQFDCLVI